MTEGDWIKEREVILHRLNQHDDGIERLDRSVRSLHDAVVELKTTIKVMGAVLAVALVAAQIVAQFLQ